jgi:chemotaxis protein histidine kinase CheA
MSAATATMSFDVSAAVMSSMTKSYQEFGLQLVESLSQKYGFSIDEAVVAIGLDSLTVSKKVSKKASKGEPKPKKEKAPKKVKPSVPLPFVGVIVDDACFGINFNKGLHTQCTNSPLETGEYCTKCQKQADGNASGKPNMGDIRDRMECDLLDFHDPKGRRTLPYVNVVAKMGLDMEKCLEEASKIGITIPSCHLEVRETKRGRPKKSVDGSDAESQASSENKPKKSRGRPKKEKSVDSVVGDDLLSAILASEANAEAVSDSESAVTKKSTRSRLTAEEKAERNAMKEAEKKAKVAERNAKLAEKEAAKAAKQAEKEAAKAAKQAEKEAAKAAKQAEKEAAKAAKQAEKEAAKAAKQQKKSPKIVIMPEPVAEPVVESESKCDESVSDVEEDEQYGTLLKYNGKEYIIDEDNIVYDIKTREAIYQWDPINKCLDELEDEDEDELEYDE